MVWEGSSTLSSYTTCPQKNDPLYFLTSNTDCLYKKAPVGGVDIAIQHLCINELPLEAEHVVRQVNMWYSAHYFIVKYVGVLSHNKLWLGDTYLANSAYKHLFSDGS